MLVYLAPLQGITDWIFREAFTKHIAQFDKYFSPFIRVENNKLDRPSQVKDILSQNNTLQKPVPQFLGNDYESYTLFENICNENSYGEVNLNFGCPYPMVSKRNMGAGILEKSHILDTLLKNIFKSTNKKISIKCRLGNNSAHEINTLIPIFNSYPIHEIIIHPRIGKQMYKGSADVSAFCKIAPQISAPLCYNGDILTAEKINEIQNISPNIKAIMIGRGILYNYRLLNIIKQTDVDSNSIKNYHKKFIKLCEKKYSGDAAIMKRIVEMWSYNAIANENKKVYKSIKKCKNRNEYLQILNSIEF